MARSSTYLLASLLLGASTLPAPAAEPKAAGPPKVTISRATTYFTKPLTRHGWVDYGKAINDRMRDGVTPENNAVVGLIRVLGPAPEGRRLPDPFFDQIGMPAPPKDGDYFIDLPDYLRGRADLAAEDPRHQQILAQQARASEGPWTAKQYPELAAWLQSNDGPLVELVEATKRPRHFAPVILPLGGADDPAGLLAIPLPWLQQYRALVRALTARAMLRAAEGKAAAAWEDLLASHRLARLAGQGPTVIDALVGLAIEVSTHQTDLAFVEATRPDAPRIAAYVRDLDGLAPLPRIADKVDVGERCVYLDSALLIARGTRNAAAVLNAEEELVDLARLIRSTGSAEIDWDVVLRLGNERYDQLVKAMRTQGYAERTRALAVPGADRVAVSEVLKDPERKLREAAEDKNPRIARAQVVDRFLAAVLIPALRTSRQTEDRVTQANRNLRIAFSLQAYRSDQNRFPEHLEQLTPKYLGAVPDDLFAERPLAYRRAQDGYRLYSVGPNGRDEGGHASDEDPPGDDLRVEMPIRKH